jgi:hypothetical protein
MRISFLRGALVGAALVYFFDSQMGRSRRAKAVDKFIHYRQKAKKLAAGKSVDLWNRSRGLAFKTVRDLRQKRAAGRQHLSESERDSE